ncbi:hypothetical protein [Streptomyces sp. NPDC001816]|uniref:hypothetical protein n=1 Tax=Streptomyces sp. NPDC001816 TaxID=3364612 RepID=UPI0036AB53B8
MTPLAASEVGNTIAAACSAGSEVRPTCPKRGPEWGRVVGAVLQVQGDGGPGAAGAVAFARMPWFRYIVSRDWVRPAKP